MGRRTVLKALGAVAWPMVARAQHPAMPVIGFLNNTTLSGQADRIAAFHRGLSENGFVVGQNLAVEYRSADGRTGEQSATWLNDGSLRCSSPQMLPSWGGEIVW
jgi:hypothetical protein